MNSPEHRGPADNERAGMSLARRRQISLRLALLAGTVLMGAGLLLPRPYKFPLILAALTVAVILGAFVLLRWTNGWGTWFEGLSQEIIGGLVSGIVIVLFADLLLAPLLEPKLEISEMPQFNVHQFHEIPIKNWGGQIVQVGFEVHNSRGKTAFNVVMLLHLTSRSGGQFENQLVRLFVAKDGASFAPPTAGRDLRMAFPDKHFARIPLGELNGGERFQVVAEVGGQPDVDVKLLVDVSPNGPPEPRPFPIKD